MSAGVGNDQPSAVGRLRIFIDYDDDNDNDKKDLMATTGGLRRDDE
jgi:hypothetical protein